MWHPQGGYLHNPDRAAARSTLLRVRNPAVFEYDETEFEPFVDQKRPLRASMA